VEGYLFPIITVICFAVKVAESHITGGVRHLNALNVVMNNVGIMEFTRVNVDLVIAQKNRNVR